MEKVTVFKSRHQLKSAHPQSGINMVDLMMWLVIAALLLAAAIQGIAYYQRAAYLYQMKQAVEVAAGKITATAAIEGTPITKTIIESVVAEQNAATPDDHILLSSGDVASYAAGENASESYGFERSSVVTATGGQVSFIKATHDAVPDKEVAYFFERTASYFTGVNVVDAGKLEIISTPAADPSTPASPVATPPDFTKPPVWTNQSGIGVNVWYGVTISDDGKKMAVAPSYDPTVANNGGRIMTSSDAGVTWTEQKGSPLANWRQITSSSDGSVILAGQMSSPVVGETDGYIYMSKDSGVTWSKVTATGVGNWYSISLSSDARHQLVSSYQGYSFVSHDYGVTWTKITEVTATANSGYGNWYTSTMSGDGKTLVMAKYNGYIYTSVDGGATWKEQTQSGVGTWVNAASSTDGSKLIISQIKNNVVASGKIFTSSDFGNTWIEQTGAGIANWRGVAMSADGTKMIAGQIDTTLIPESGVVLFSTDSGVTWKQTDLPKGTYYRLAITRDGSKFIAGNAIPQQLFTGVVK